MTILVIVHGSRLVEASRCVCTQTSSRLIVEQHACIVDEDAAHACNAVRHALDAAVLGARSSSNVVHGIRLVSPVIQVDDPLSTCKFWARKVWCRAGHVRGVSFADGENAIAGRRSMFDVRRSAGDSRRGEGAHRLIYSRGRRCDVGGTGVRSGMCTCRQSHCRRPWWSYFNLPYGAIPPDVLGTIYLGLV